MVPLQDPPWDGKRTLRVSPGWGLERPERLWEVHWGDQVAVCWKQGLRDYHQGHRRPLDPAVRGEEALVPGLPEVGLGQHHAQLVDQAFHVS